MIIGENSSLLNIPGHLCMLQDIIVIGVPEQPDPPSQARVFDVTPPPHDTRVSLPELLVKVLPVTVGLFFTQAP